MALPVILVNHATGSDSAASGAGPATAITGAAASTSADGLVVTLDGLPDLSGVATDGSAVIYLADATAGNRNFGKITAADNSAKTVTVSDAFGTSLSSLSWAIGGKRASIGSATSRKLSNNNNANGDLMPGWAIEMESGHAETLSAEYRVYGSGGASGMITIRGASGAATRPKLTFTNNDRGFLTVVNPTTGRAFIGFDLENTHASPGGTCFAFEAGRGAYVMIFEDLIIDGFYRGINVAHTESGITTRRVEIKNCTNTGISGQGLIVNCYIHDNVSDGVFTNFTSPNAVNGLLIMNCIIINNGGVGIRLVGSSQNTTTSRFAYAVLFSTIHNNAGDGIYGTSNGLYGMLVANNSITKNGGYGLQIQNAYLDIFAHIITNNNFGTGDTANTSGALGTNAAHAENSFNVDPGYANAAGGDFTPGTAMRGIGWPSEIYVTGVSNYPDIGAIQAEPTAGGGAGGYVPFRSFGIGFQRS